MYVVGLLTNLTHNTRIYKNFKIIWNIGMENIMHNWKIKISSRVKYKHILTHII